jgi:hypothetical protein
MVAISAAAVRTALDWASWRRSANSEILQNTRVRECHEASKQLSMALLSHIYTRLNRAFSSLNREFSSLNSSSSVTSSSALILFNFASTDFASAACFLSSLVIFCCRSWNASTRSGRSFSSREKVSIASVEAGLLLADRRPVEEAPTREEDAGSILGARTGIPFVYEVLGLLGVAEGGLCVRKTFDCGNYSYQQGLITRMT